MNANSNLLESFCFNKDFETGILTKICTNTRITNNLHMFLAGLWLKWLNSIQIANTYLVFPLRYIMSAAKKK